MTHKKDYLIEHEAQSIIGYINIIRTHLVKVVLITLFVFALSIAYAVTARDIFKATTILKISPPEGNILEAPLMGELGLGDRGADRFIANEIETLQNITIRERVALQIVESYKVTDYKENYSLIIDKSDYFEENKDSIKSSKSIANMLFDQLPKASIGLARIERARMSAEQLFVKLEEKYQEALLNEQATTGNVLILSHAREPEIPSKPNRRMIVVIGLVLGLTFGVGYAIIATYFDKTIKTPEDIEDLHINLLGWIPQIEEFGTNGNFSEVFYCLSTCA